MSLACDVSSASLPPCQPRSATHRALRGQSPATAHQAATQQQPSWAFIGAGSAASHSGLAVNSQAALPTWHNLPTAATTAAAAAAAGASANLMWRPPAHLDQTAATVVS